MMVFLHLIFFPRILQLITAPVCICLLLHTSRQRNNRTKKHLRKATDVVCFGCIRQNQFELKMFDAMPLYAIVFTIISSGGGKDSLTIQTYRIGRCCHSTWCSILQEHGKGSNYILTVLFQMQKNTATKECAWKFNKNPFPWLARNPNNVFVVVLSPESSVHTARWRRIIRTRDWRCIAVGVHLHTFIRIQYTQALAFVSSDCAYETYTPQQTQRRKKSNYNIHFKTFIRTNFRGNEKVLFNETFLTIFFVLYFWKCPLESLM